MSSRCRTVGASASLSRRVGLALRHQVAWFPAVTLHRVGPDWLTSRLTYLMKVLNPESARTIMHTSSPLAGIHGTGHVTIRKGELPNLDGDKNMIELERFRNPGTGALAASAFSTFDGDLELRDNRIYSKRIAVNFYGTDVVGSGSTSVVDGAMDYRGVAIVLKQQGLVTSLFARIFKEAQEKNGRLTFPL